VFGEPPWKGGDKDHPITAIRDAFHVIAALVSIDARGPVLVVAAGMHSALSALASIGGKDCLRTVRMPFRAEAPEPVARKDAILSRSAGTG